MRNTNSFGDAVVLVGIVSVQLMLATPSPLAAACIARAVKSPANKAPAKPAQRECMRLDVMLDEVDYTANTITASATVHVVAPQETVGGQVATTGSTRSHQEQVAKYVRLPVMPEARLQQKHPAAGQHAILHLAMQRGALVVVGIEQFTGVERIGVDWLDAPGAAKDK